MSLAPRKRLWLWVPLVRCTVRVIAKVTDQRVIWPTLQAFRLRPPRIERINGTNRKIHCFSVQNVLCVRG